MIYKQIEGLNYEISKDGRVRNSKTRKFIKPHLDGTKRYLCVMLADGKMNGRKIQKGRYLHRLIAMAFIPNPDNKPQVNHINGNKLDNRLENLEWVTQGENNKHAYDTGLKTHKPLHYKGKFGFEHNKSKAVRLLNTGEVFGSMSEAGRKLGIDVSSVSWAIKHNSQIYGMRFEKLET